jgi:DNA-binding GntR family transcriptional regulator
MRVDEVVHRLVWEACGNPYMDAALERLFALSLRIWYLVLDREPGLAASVHDQRQLLDALIARDGARARTLMRDHVLAFQREVLVAFAS